MPAIQLTYAGTGGALSLDEVTAAAADNVTISELTTGTLTIDLNGATFDAGSTAAASGLNYEVAGDPANSTFATVDISSANAITTFSANLGDDDDSLAIGFSQGVGDVNLQGGNGTDTVTLNALTSAGNLTVAAERVDLNGGITTAGDQTFNGNATLSANVTLTSNNNGAISFAQTLDGNFTLAADTGGNTTFGGAVGNGTPLRSLATDAPGNTAISANVTTNDNQSYGDNVTLTGNATLTSNNNGDISFNQTLDGNFTLAVNTGGNTTFGGAVGGGTPLKQLMTDPNGATSLGANVTTNGNQTYADNVTLTGNATLTSKNSGAISFNQTLDGNFTLAADTAGGTNFFGTVGGKTPLASLATDAPGLTRVAANVTTSGGQDYGDQLALFANLTLVSTNNGTISFAQADNNFALSVDTGGLTNFTAPVGSLVPLLNLATDANGTTDVAANVTTNDNQAYGDNVTLTGNATLKSNNNGDISFNQTLDGDFTLAANTGGNTTFGGAVGNGTPLQSLGTDAGGNTTVSGGVVKTSGDQTFNDPVILTADTTLTDSGTGITFNNTVNGDGNGPWNLTAVTSSAAGQIQFNGTVGGANPLKSLTVNDAGSASASAAIQGAGTTLTKQGGGTFTLAATNTYSGATTISAGTLLVNGSTASGSAVAVNNGGALGGTGTVNGSVTVNTGGTINPGTAGAVGTLTVGSLSFNGGTYQADLDPNAGSADQIATAGAVNLANSTQGVFSLNVLNNTAPADSTVFTLIQNTGAAIANPPLANAPENGSVSINGKTAIYTYHGGTSGNSFTLAVSGAATYSGSGQLKVGLDAMGTDLQFFVNNVLHDSRPLSSITSIAVNGAATADTLTLDYTNGVFLKPITFDGMTGGDTLELIGNTLTSLEYQATAPHAGTLILNGDTTDTVGFSNLAPVVVTSMVGTTTVTISDNNPHTATFTAGPGAGNNTVSIDGGLESMTFVNPTAALVVNGNSAADTFTFTSLDAGFNAALTVNGKTASDTINLNANLTLGSATSTGNVSLTAQTINVNGTIDTTAGSPGDVTMTAGQNISVTSTGAVKTAGIGNITLTADGLSLDTTSAVINAGTNTVTLRQETDVALSVDATQQSGRLSLTDAELDRITAGQLVLGRNDSGFTQDLTLNAPITAHAGYNALTLLSGGAILDSDTGETEPSNPTDDFTNGASVDITVGTLNLSASTGIGVVSGMGVGPLETQVSNLEANTATGGIFITNGVTSAITLNVVGNGFGPPDGLVVTGASGDIQLINQGSIDITTNNDVVLGPGNVTIQAFGAAADILAGGYNAPMGSTGAGNVTLTAGEDVLLGNKADGSFGSFGTNTGAVSVSAGRDLVVQDAGVISVAGGSGNITATAVRNISILSDQQDSARITNGGTGQVSLTTGAGGVFTLDSGGGGVVLTNGADITISADDMVFPSPLVAITTGGSTGVVTLQQATGGMGSTPVNIDLGGGTTAGDLNLSDAELGQVTAKVLRIGRTDNTGSLTVTAPVTAHSGFSTLTLLSGGSITETGTGAITVANLDVQGAGGVNLSTNASTVSGNLSGSTGGQPFSFTNSASLTVDTADTQGGISTAGGVVTLTAQGPGSLLTVNQPIAAGNADVDLNADDMALNATVSAGTANVNLAPVTAGQKTDIGLGTTAGDLGLSDTELGKITAGILRVGSSTAGDITLTGNVTTHAGYGTLSLLTGGGIVEGAGTLGVTNLALSASSGIGDAAPLLTAVTNLIFSNLAGGAVQISNTGAVTIAAVDNLLAALNQGGTTSLTAAGALTFAVNTTSAGALTATAAGGAGGTNNLTVNGGVTVQTTGASGDVTLQAGDLVSIPATATAQASGNLNITGGLNESAADTDGGATVNGTVVGTAVNVSGGAGADVFNLNVAAGSSAQVTASAGANSGDHAIFNVTPSGSTTYTVNGIDAGSAEATPADTLNVNTAGTTGLALSGVTQTGDDFSGAFTFINRKPVNFTAMDVLIPTADLKVSEAGPTTAPEGGSLTYMLTVHNNGPSDDGTVTVTDVVTGGPLASLSAQASQGTFSIAGNTVTFTLGALASGATATLTVTAVPQQVGTYTSAAAVTGNLPDPVPGTNSTSLSTIVTPVAVTGGGIPLQGFEGTALASDTVVATFTHAGGVEPAANFSATISWGDGTSSAGTVVQQGTSYAVLGGHTYGDEGTYAVGVQVTDGPASATLTSAALVLEALLPPGSPHGPIGTANERFISEVYHDLFNLPVDPGTLARFGSRLDHGLSRRTFVHNLLRVPVLHGLFEAGLVRDLYQTFRGRAATDAEVSAALRLIGRHGFLAFARRFLGSSPKATDAELAQVLVLTFLDPPAAPVSADVPAKHLKAGMTAADTAAALLGRNEYFVKTVL